MPTLRPLVFALLPLFSGCQMLETFSEPETAGQTRLQGEISQPAEQLLFKSCNGETSYALVGQPGDKLNEQASKLLAETGKPLFADLRGNLESGTPPRLSVTQIYRLQGEGWGCSDPNFSKLLVRASGNEPDWNINLNRKGMVLERMGEDPVAMPYVEEQLPDGSFNISTQADGLQLDLWLTPKQCTDTMSGNILHMTAELKINGKLLQGCAAYGAMRSD